ncbi:unnamed protein product [Paramecium sonneborni]|uniref:Uncharacterized protein n=1 Tax=Paramecium sonneborni TaxID=65129 RepID=A0A8S1KYY0_9CILI|nr:unnamed protein product [Paramecium sonneborni]
MFTYNINQSFIIAKRQKLFLEDQVYLPITSCFANFNSNFASNYQINSQFDNLRQELNNQKIGQPRLKLKFARSFQLKSINN